MSDVMAVPFEGKPVEIGGRNFVVPPLTIGQLKRLRPKIEAMASAKPDASAMDQVDDIIDIIHAAIGRNYPDLTVDELADMIPLPDVQRIVEEVMSASGLEKTSGNGAAGTD